MTQTRKPAAKSEKTFAEQVESFKARFPDVWESIKLGPTQHGLDQMIEVLDR